ncbi:MAG: D-alanine--D-alanine ligase [Spirochaetales bacterium]|nr:D-alanine--D-alanine ligase [Spirochaetales bacterium]
MKKHNIAILYGGRSGEHDVSLLSASSVEKHLNKEKYNISLIGITLNGVWYYQENYINNSDCLEIIEDDSNIVSLIPGRGLMVKGIILPIDFIFPILHGTYGEDGTMQGLLEIVGIPFAGSGMDGSYLAMDKEVAKIIWDREGLPIVPFIGIKKHDYLKNPNDIKSRSQDKFGYPVFIKPVKAGSSVGVSRVESQDEFFAALDKAFKYDTKVLIEPAVNAREIECSVVGNYNLETFALGEIAPSHKFYDYDAKYIDPNGAKLIIPAVIDDSIATEMKRLAKSAYLALNLKGFSRVDFFLDKESNKIMINEINTIPGFTNISMFSMLCAHNGLGYSELLDRIFELGIERYQEVLSMDFSH